MTYPLKFRQQVLSIQEKENLTLTQNAQRFAVGIAPVMRWVKKLQPAITRNKPDATINMSALLLNVKNYPDVYLRERAHRFGVSSSGIKLALKRLDVSRKKNAATSQSKRTSTSYLPKNNQDRSS